jgi:hypothetical protein
MQTAIKKNRLPVETIKDKVSVRNSNINKRDHFFDDRLFWKQLLPIRYCSLYIFYISIIKLKKICEFHILAPKELQWKAFLFCTYLSCSVGRIIFHWKKFYFLSPIFQLLRVWPFFSCRDKRDSGHEKVCPGGL